jgi:hypothetical protein
MPSANIQISPLAATNDVQQTTSHVLTIHANVINSANPNGTNAPAGTVLTAHVDSGPGSLASTTCTTVATTGSCTVTLNNTAKTTGITVVSACALTLPGGPCTGDGKSGDSANAQKQWVDATIVLSPHEAFNIVGQNHVITATVQQDKGPGQVSNVSGALVTFTIVSDTTGAGHFVPNNSANSCTTNASGQCTITIVSANAGDMEVSASTTFNIAGVGSTSVNVTRATSGSVQDAIKHFFSPSTTLSVSDKLVGLPSSAQGSVTYTVFTNSTCTNMATSFGNGGNITQTGNSAVVNGIAPSSMTVDVTKGTVLYFQATFNANNTSGVQSFSQPCTLETASSN